MRDGFSFNNSSHITVQDSFVRGDDDVVTAYGLPWNGNSPMDTITMTRTVLWTDRANVWRLGLICSAEYMRNFTFTDIDVIHMDTRGQEWCIQLTPCQNMPMENFRFENIRINNERNNNMIKLKPEVGSWHPYSLPPEGRIQGVYFKNITFSSSLGNINIYGPSADHNVKDVTFENVVRFGQLTTANSPNVSVSGYTSNINFTKLLIRSKISEEKRNLRPFPHCPSVYQPYAPAVENSYLRTSDSKS